MTEENTPEVLAPWVAVQKKTFTKWTNSHLKKVGTQIDEVQNEFDNGIKLMQLIKALYGTEIPKYNANPKMRPHKLDNLTIAFSMIEKAQIKTNFFKTTHLLDHDLKMILGMIWAIILDYQIKGISVEDLSAKEALLLWCQKKTKGYNNVKVIDFSASWRDGLALAALIHHHRPNLIDFDSLNKDDHKATIKLVFDVARDSLGIDPLLDVEDLDVDRPDDKSVMTYVSEFYHKFTSQNQKEVAARRIQKFATFNKNAETTEQQYVQKAEQILVWINDQIIALNDRNFGNDMKSVQEKIQKHREYKEKDKQNWGEVKSENEALYTSIQISLKSNKRKVWTAPQGITVEEVDVAWEQLGEAEKNRGKALRDHLNKQKDDLRKKYAELANEFYDFIVGFKKDISDSGTREPQDQLAYLKKRESELEKDSRPDELKTSYNLLEELGLADENPYTDLTLEELILLLESVKNGLKKKKQAIQSQLASSGQSNITDDQIAEFQDTFRHFDKDRSGELDKLEFKACLATLGQSFNDENAFNNLFRKLAGNKDKIDMDTFVKYMISLMEDTDDAIQIKQSFKILANDRSTIGSNDLNYPPLESELINYLTDRMKGSDPDYNYSHYTDDVFA